MDVNAQLSNLRRVSTNISFGNSNSDPQKNIQGWDSGNITTPGTANTQFPVTHNLGYVPTRFHVTYNNGQGTVYAGPTAWTTTTVYLMCSAASSVIRVFIY